MSKVHTHIKFTYEDYLSLPDDKRYELIEGELYMVPAHRPYHQIVLAEIEDHLRRYIKEHDLGIVILAPCDVFLSEENVVQPDIMVIAKDRLAIIEETRINGAPDMVVEVLSPEKPELDLKYKRTIYARYGVREYWIVDPGKKTVDVLVRRQRKLETQQVYLLGDVLTSPFLKGFSLEVAAAFPSI